MEINQKTIDNNIDFVIDIFKSIHPDKIHLLKDEFSINFIEYSRMPHSDKEYFGIDFISENGVEIVIVVPWKFDRFMVFEDFKIELIKHIREKSLSQLL